MSVILNQIAVKSVQIELNADEERNKNIILCMKIEIIVIRSCTHI
jgi:hypothetical protein